MGLGRGRDGRADAAASPAEEATEDVPQVEVAQEVVEGAGPRLSRPPPDVTGPWRALLAELLGLLPVVAEPVVEAAALRIGENLVCFVDLLEPLGRVGLAGIQVRVVLADQPPERGPDLPFARGAGNAQQVVVVLCHFETLRLQHSNLYVVVKIFQGVTP